jgi:hypothetical protein
MRHWVERGLFTLGSANMEDLVERSLQAWRLQSTIVATALFGLIACKIEELRRQLDRSSSKNPLAYLADHCRRMCLRLHVGHGG